VLIVHQELAGQALVSVLAAREPMVELSREELRPRRPFVGRLFEVIARAAGRPSPVEQAPVSSADERVVDSYAGDADRRPTLTLVLPMRWLAGGPVPDLVWVADHVNLELRGPLTGRWPVSGPRSFPAMHDLYRAPTDLTDSGALASAMATGSLGSSPGAPPPIVPVAPQRRTGGERQLPPPGVAGEARVYSQVTVAGVANVARPTPFERHELRANGFVAACDCLVPATIIAAYYGLAVIAFGVPRPADRRRKKGTP